MLVTLVGRHWFPSVIVHDVVTDGLVEVALCDDLLQLFVNLMLSARKCEHALK